MLSKLESIFIMKYYFLKTVRFRIARLLFEGTVPLANIPPSASSRTTIFDLRNPSLVMYDIVTEKAIFPRSPVTNVSIF